MIPKYKNKEQLTTSGVDAGVEADDEDAEEIVDDTEPLLDLVRGRSNRMGACLAFLDGLRLTVSSLSVNLLAFFF